MRPVKRISRDLAEDYIRELLADAIDHVGEIRDLLFEEKTLLAFSATTNLLEALHKQQKDRTRP